MTDNAFSRIIDAAATDNGLDIRNTFDNLMIAKVQRDIEARKIEIAKQMFAGPFESEPKEETPPEESEEGDNEESEVELSDDEIEEFLNTIETEEGESDEITT